jgi:ribosomal protein S10
MERESARIKIKPKTSPEQLYNSMEQRKMNLTCKEVIKAFEDIISMLFGPEELATFGMDYSTKNHLQIVDKKTGETYTASCHFKNKMDQFNPGKIQQLMRLMDTSIKFRQNELEPQEPEETTAEMPRFRKVEAKRSKMHPGGLKDWVENENWVDVRRPKKDGGYEPCGRNDTSKGSKPVCVPSNKAKNLDKKELENRKRQKAKKEKEPNPGKKPNTTKYTEEAGGKSNVSETNNIRFVGSMITLSELKPVQPKFVKIALMGEEDEIPSTDISQLFSESDKEVDEIVEKVIKSATRILGSMFSGGLTGPGDVGSNESASLSNFLSEIMDADVSQMDEKQYLKYVKIINQIKRVMFKQAIDNNDSRMHEICHKMLLKGTSPFSNSDIAEIVREMINKRN